LIGADKAGRCDFEGESFYSAQESLEKLRLVDEVAPRDQICRSCAEEVADGKRKPSPAPKIDQGNSCAAQSQSGAGARLESDQKGLLASTQKIACPLSWTRLSISANRNRLKI